MSEPIVSQPIKQELPSVSLNEEEVELITNGLNLLDKDKRKTVVFERLLSKIRLVKEFWAEINKIRKIKMENLAKKLSKNNG